MKGSRATASHATEHLQALDDDARSREITTAARVSGVVSSRVRASSAERDRGSSPWLMRAGPRCAPAPSSGARSCCSDGRDNAELAG